MTAFLLKRAQNLASEGTSITRWRGWAIPDRDLGAWIVPTFHPSYVMRKVHEGKDGGLTEKIWLQDLMLAKSLLHRPHPKKILEDRGWKEESECIRLISPAEAVKVLDGIRRGAVIAFDYETTGLKPQQRGHRIVCASVATSPNRCYAFPLKGKNVKKALVRVLRNPNIRKVASNLQFEHTWTRVILGTEVRGWMFDTMLAAHIIDNRRGVSGLKFLSYVYLGIPEYNSNVHERLFTRKSGEGGNAFNQIQEIPMKDLLWYNGMDSILELRLYYILKEILNGKN